MIRVSVEGRRARAQDLRTISAAMARPRVLAALIGALFCRASALNNGLARTPPMVRIIVAIILHVMPDTDHRR